TGNNNNLTVTGDADLYGTVDVPTMQVTGTAFLENASKITGDLNAPTLDYSNYGSAVTFDLANTSGGTTGIGGIWAGVSNVAGSSNSDTITGNGQTYALDNSTANK